MSGFDGAIVRRRRRRHMRQTVGVEDAFPIVIIGFSIIAIVVAVIVAVSSGGLYDRIGRGDFALDHDDARAGPAPGSAQAKAEADEEIRQLMEAKSERRVARGEAPLDVDAEIAALTGSATPSADEGLRAEVRQLVIARNERRMRRGQEPLDVEAEVDRQLRDLGA
jgi:hypothetical protein